MKVGKKGPKKKVVDWFSKNDWYYVKALVFSQYFLSEIHILYENTSHGELKEPKQYLMASRVIVFEVSLPVLQNDEVAFKNQASYWDCSGQKTALLISMRDLLIFLLSTKKDGLGTNFQVMPH